MGAFVTKYNPEEVEEKPIVITKRLEVSAVQPPPDVIIRNGYISDWGNNRRDVIWDVTFNSTGIVNVALGLSNRLHHGHAEIKIKISGEKLFYNLSSNDFTETCKTVNVGSVTIRKTGFNSIRVRAKEDKKGAVGQLYFLQFTGPAVKDLEIHTHDVGKIVKASDVRLLWNISCCKVNMFYNEINVQSKSTDALFVACGFYRGYVGFENDDIVFCIDNPGLAPEIPKEKIPDRYKVKVVNQAHGSRIQFVDGHLKAICYYYHRWCVGETYSFLLTAKACSTEDYVLYSAFFHRKESKNWVLIGTFKVIDLHLFFTELYSSIENCQSFHGYTQYIANFGPAFKHIVGKGWHQITHAQFAHFGLTGDVNATITEDNNLSLSTGENTVKLILSDGELHCHRAKTLPECLSDFNAENLLHSHH